MINVVLALRSGRHFGKRDVELLAHHIHKTSDVVLHCLTDIELNIPGVEEIPLDYGWKKWWCRMELYSPKMLNLRPFLFVDLDTAVLGSLNELVAQIPDQNMYVPLEDFYQKNKLLATGLLWMPKDNEKINRVWIEWIKAKCPATETRMDYFLRGVITPDMFWQQITKDIGDFKPRRQPLMENPTGYKVVCFHGRPSIWEADIDWVKKYRNYE